MTNVVKLNPETHSFVCTQPKNSEILISTKDKHRPMNKITIHFGSDPNETEKEEFTFFVWTGYTGSPIVNGDPLENAEKRPQEIEDKTFVDTYRMDNGSDLLVYCKRENGALKTKQVEHSLVE